MGMAADVNIDSSATRGISVVIPAYNYARFLPKAIDSALRQEHPANEILVVDDGSTDNTAEVVARYGPPVRCIYQENAGLPAARNTGIKAARFSHIAFLDADDEWLPGMLRRAMELFAGLPEDFALVACMALFVDENSASLNTKNLVPGQPREISCRDIILATRFSPSAVVAKRAALEACGLFDPALRSSEDRDMWIRLAARYRLLLNGEQLALIRRHSSNMSRHADRMKNAMCQVIAKARRDRLVPRNHLLFWSKVFSFTNFQAAWMHRDEGRYGRALAEMTLSFVLWPCFLHPEQLNEPALFRLRSLLRFVREIIRGHA